MEKSGYLPVSYTVTLTTDTPLMSLGHAPSITTKTVSVCVHVCVLYLCMSGEAALMQVFTFDHAVKHNVLNIS